MTLSCASASLERKVFLRPSTKYNKSDFYTWSREFLSLELSGGGTGSNVLMSELDVVSHQHLGLLEGDVHRLPGRAPSSPSVQRAPMGQGRTGILITAKLHFTYSVHREHNRV